MKKIFIVIFILTSFTSIFAQQNDFDARVAEGIKNIYNIRFDEADRQFKSLIADYPNHPAGKFFLAMIEWWRILLDLENESMDDNFFARLEDVIYQCDDILDKDSKNVDALFFKGGAIGFRGRLRAIRESWLKAADDGREALPIVQRAYKLNPDNKDVQLGFGIYNYYAAVIPQKYPIVKPLMIFFPSGDKEKGIKELTDAAFNGRYAKTEAKYFLMQLYYQYEENLTKALEFADLLVGEYPNNPLFQRYQGRIYIRQGNYFMGTRIFSEVYKRCNESWAGYNSYAKREASYYLGVEKKMAGQLDSAAHYFRECEELSRKVDGSETSGFRVNSVLYLGQLNDQMGNREQAVAYYNELLGMKEYNNSHSAAKQYLERPYGK